MRKKIVLVSKYFIPYSNVDTNAVYDLIIHLQSINPDIEIHVVTSASNYKTDIKLRDFDEEALSKVTVHHIKSISTSSDSKIRKLLYGLIEGFRLIRFAKNLDIETIISLSNPALIVMWATLFLQNKRYIYWSFDLYPDAFIADDIIKKENPIYKLINYFTYKNAPSGLLALGEEQYAYLKEKFRSESIDKYLLPCGIHEVSKSKKEPDWYRADKINVAYVGNIGKAHSVTFLKNFITEVNRFENINFFLTIYGFHADKIEQFVEKKAFKNVYFVPKVLQEDLGYIDIHLVSLRKSWTHISVPSKAVSAICSGSALWFCGSKDSDTWNMFSRASYFSNSDKESIIRGLNLISSKSLQEKKEESMNYSSELLNLERETLRSLILE